MAEASTLNTLIGGDLRRRLVYLMLFRVIVVSLVLGVTSVLYWFSDVDVASPAAVAMYGVIVATYVLSVVYALVLRSNKNVERLADIQLVMDLVIATVLVHITGGAQSAYTFFFPLAIIGAAVLRLKGGVLVVGPMAAALFVSVSLADWTGVLPVLEGAQFRPTDLSGVSFIRALSLNLAGIAAVSALAVNLGGQLERASASLEHERSAAADLLSLHKDIIRSLTSGLITVDEQDKVITFNRSACEILRRRSRDVDGAHLPALFPSLDLTLKEIGRLGCVPRGEASIEAGDTTVCVGYSLSPLFNHRNEVMGRVIHFQDLTEMRSMEASVKRAERLAVIGRLAAGVAHEIRNPLASISGSIELLHQTYSPEDSDGRALMNIVTREVDRLDALISELLDYANPRPLKRVSVDLRELVRDTLRVFRSDPRFAGVSLADNLDEEVLDSKVEADPEKLRQVIWNLVRNGAEAANHAVSVEVGCERDCIVLHVADDGPGITKDVQERVFDPFFTTKNTGTGLGLATVHTIVQDHGGEIQVASDVGFGSTFTITLPRNV